MRHRGLPWKPVLHYVGEFTQRNRAIESHADRYKVSFDVGVEQGDAPLAEIRDTDFHVAILGDFSGRGQSGQASADPPTPRTPKLVDADNILTLAGFRPAIRIGGGSEGSTDLTLDLKALEDFHPDQLRDKIPSTWETATEEAITTPADSTLTEESRPPLEPNAEPATGPLPLQQPSGFLDAILDKAETTPFRMSPQDDLGAFIDEAVRSHLVHPEPISDKPDPIAAGVRRVLADPGFRAMETLWGAVFQLVRLCTPAPGIRIHLIDCSRAEYDTVRSAADDPAAALARHFGFGADAPPPTLLVAAYGFGAGEADWGELWDLANLGARLGTACLVGVADPESCKGPGWNDLRANPDARFLGVVTPRVLTRVPYGSGLEECEVPFEEHPLPDSADPHVWGDAAIPAAWFFIHALSPEGLKSRLGDTRALEGLPSYTRDAEGRVATQRCLDRVFTDKEAEDVASQGLMPLRLSEALGRAHMGRLQMLGRTGDQGPGDQT